MHRLPLGKGEPVKNKKGTTDEHGYFIGVDLCSSAVSVLMGKITPNVALFFAKWRSREG
jgi:hypothetical protein